MRKIVVITVLLYHLKWAWEIYKEADHLVHTRTTFFFAAQSFLVLAYSTFAVSRN